MIPSGEVAAVKPLSPTIQNNEPFHVMDVQPEPGRVRAVQVVPVGDVAAWLLWEMTQNTVPFQATPIHVLELGNTLSVHVIPSADVIALFVEPATAQKLVPFAPIPVHLEIARFSLGGVRNVHVIPSGEVAASSVVPPLVSTVKTAAVAFQAIAFQFLDAGRVRAVQVIPSADVAALVLPEAIIQNTDPFQAIPTQLAVDGRVRAVHVVPVGDVAARLVA